MAFTKILLSGDAATELTGTAYRTLLVNSAGAVAELAHGTDGHFLKSGGASADPSWAAASVAAINDIGDVTITTPADNEVLAYDGVSDFINQTPAEAGLLADTANVIDSDHYVDGSIDLAHLAADCVDGTKIADNAVDTEHLAADAVDAAAIDDSATDIALNQVILTPKADGDGTTEGTIFYDSDDDHLYVYVTA